MADLLFVGQFIASKAGKTGLTVTVNVDRYTLADGSRTALVTAGSATEGRRGLYHYRLASADLATYQYVATFITADATVDQQEIAALGIVVPDALVGSRLAPATAGRTLAVDASGNAAANVTYSAGVALAGRLAEYADVSPLALEATAQAVLAVIGAGSGTGLYTDTITNGSAPLDGVRVQLSTDEVGEHRVYETFTNALGVFVLRPDPGTYYRWLDLAGITFEQGVEVEVTA